MNLSDGTCAAPSVQETMALIPGNKRVLRTGGTLLLRRKGRERAPPEGQIQFAQKTWEHFGQIARGNRDREKTGFVKSPKNGKIVNLTEEFKHAPRRITLREKIRENLKKALDNQHFDRYTGTVSQNGIERPKGNLDFCRFSKVCENRRISHRKPRSRWSAFAKFYNLWNRSGRILWSRSSPYKTVEPPE